MAGTLAEGFIITGSVTTGSNTTATIVRACTLYDATCFCTATSGAQGISVNTSGGAFTDVIVCATNEAVARPLTCNNAASAVGAGTTLTFTNSGTASGIVSAFCTIDGSTVAQ